MAAPPHTSRPHSPEPMDIDSPPVAPQPASEEDEIPPLTTVFPAIFVPLTQDLLKPSQPPKDRIERLKRILESLDSNERGVKDNLLWMFEREKTRILNEAAKARQQARAAAGPNAPPATPQTVSDAEADQIISNMRAPHNPALPYHVGFIGHLDPYASLEGHTAEERTSREMLNLIEKGVEQLVRYSNTHMLAIKNEFKARLEKELEKYKDLPS